MTIALGIPHTPWEWKRVESLQRLRVSLAGGPEPRLFTEREPNWSWSHKLWQWGYETGAAHLLQLQDDVIVTSDFWAHLRSMLAAVPDQIIGLESVHPVAHMLNKGGQHWYTTADGLIGVGYVLPRPVLREFLEWRLSSLRTEAFKQVSEDTLIDMFCISTKRKVYHPVVTIIDHDTDLPSTYGNEHHSHRRPALSTVRGDGPADWSNTSVMNMGRFYELTARMCRRFVKEFHAEDMIAALANRGGP